MIEANSLNINDVLAGANWIHSLGLIIGCYIVQGGNFGEVEKWLKG